MYKKLFLLFLLVPLLSLADQNKEFNLTIVHTNDTHAHILPIDKNGNYCSTKDDADGKCFGGVARRMTMIKELRKTDPNLLLLDAGDQFQGTLFYWKYKGKEASHFMNKLRYQAATMGNHEFDDGSKNLAQHIKALNFPMVSANVDFSKDKFLSGITKPYIIININGQKIAITGCTTEETPTTSNPDPKIKFDNIEESVSKIVNTLQQQGINKIILISHAGYEVDKKLASKIDGIDVIVGGHTHTYLSNNSPDKETDKVEGPYPTVVKAPNGNPVLIVQSYMYGKYLGKINVTFDQSGILTNWTGNPILLDAKIKPDVEVKMEVDKMNKPLESMRQKTIGMTNINLNSNCRMEECIIGNIITDAMLKARTAQKAEIAILSGGRIRSGVMAGKISSADIIEILPFDSDKIVTFGIKGKDLLTALENGFGRVSSASGSARFPQVSGLHISWDQKLPAGKRVIDVKVNQKDGNYLPLEANKIYQIVSISFIQRGGDGYEVFKQRAINLRNYDIPISNVVADYIKKYSPINSVVTKRMANL
jgi:5'-nucleotidase/UDP-sugar diphosphatase